MTRIMVCLVAAIWTCMLAACYIPYVPPPPGVRHGAVMGAAMGATAGALIDRENQWRGAVIGGYLGALLGGTVTEIATQAAREAIQENRKVAYQSTDGWQRVEAEPVTYDNTTKCHKVRERVWQEGQLVKDEIREVCEGDQYYYE